MARCCTCGAPVPALLAHRQRPCALCTRNAARVAQGRRPVTWAQHRALVARELAARRARVARGKDLRGRLPEVSEVSAPSVSAPRRRRAPASPPRVDFLTANLDDLPIGVVPV